jgi:hypothetical protein
VSSKGRKRKDAADSFSEYFPTPGWCVHRFIERATFLPKGTWFEPCAGNGDIIQGVGDIRKSPIYWHANELRSECEPALRKLANQVVIGSFLDWKVEPNAPRQYDVIITNPPFSLAMEVILKSLELADYVCMLLRLNFLGSADRHSFFREMMPDVFVIPERPSFDGKGADSIEYAWFVWPQPEQRKRSRGSFELLDTTPLAIRKKYKPLDFRPTAQMQLLQSHGLLPAGTTPPEG